MSISEYKLTSLVLFAAICQTGLSQPTITNSILPDVGESSTFRLFDPVVESPGPGGGPVTWDFSNVSTTGTAVINYTNPSSYANGGQFQGSTFVADQGGGIMIFFKAESQKLSEIGLVTPALTENYSNNPRVVMEFPMVFGALFNDAFEGTAILGSISATRSGTSVIEADGYGTLILPYATFSDVLRVRIVSTYSDEFLSQVVNTGTDTIYSWYKEGVSNYIYTWHKIESDMFGSVHFGAYLDTMFVGNNEILKQVPPIEMWPNPARNQLYFKSDYGFGQHIEVTIIDGMGRTVKFCSISDSELQSGYSVDISTLGAGTYLVSFQNSLISERRKLIVSN